MKNRFLTVLSLAAIFASSSFLSAAQPKAQEQKVEKKVVAKDSSSRSDDCCGPRGPQGPRGRRGIPGKCEACNPSFLSVYRITPQTGITTGTAIVCDLIATSLGSALSYDGLHGTVTFNDAGIYQVIYGVQVDLTISDNNAELAANFSSTGILPGSALIFKFKSPEFYSYRMTTKSFNVAATASQTMQIVSTTKSICGPFAVEPPPNDCTFTDPVLAFLIVNKLS